MKNIAKNKNYRGFYLIEAIIALFLVTAGLLVTVDLITRITSNSFEDRDSVIAALLSQEGVELMRNFRDNNLASGKRAFANFPNFDANGNFIGGNHTICGLDINSSLAFISSNCYLPSNTPNKQGLKLSGNFYTLDPNNDAKFFRSMTFDYNVSTSTLTIWNAVIWGSAWPPGSDYEHDCTFSKKCTWSKVTLSEWGSD